MRPWSPPPLGSSRDHNTTTLPPPQCQAWASLPGWPTAFTHWPHNPGNRVSPALHSRGPTLHSTPKHAASPAGWALSLSLWVSKYQGLSAGGIPPPRTSASSSAIWGLRVRRWLQVSWAWPTGVLLALDSSADVVPTHIPHRAFLAAGVPGCSREGQGGHTQSDLTPSWEAALSGNCQQTTVQECGLCGAEEVAWVGRPLWLSVAARPGLGRATGLSESCGHNLRPGGCFCFNRAEAEKEPCCPG